MAGLTVTEKEHWKDRISNRIDKKIETLYAAKPNLKERIEREAHTQALASLHLSEISTRLAQIKAAEEELEREEEQLYLRELALVRGVPVERLPSSEVRSGYLRNSCRHHDVEKAIQRRETVHSEELLAGDEQGRVILGLQQEKDNLLDTVWLATSSAQIKELWSKVADLLGDEQTRLQREALAITPVTD